MSSKFYRQIPNVVKSLLITSNGWLVGSAPDSLLKGKIPTDYDIVVTDPKLFGHTLKQLHALDAKIDINSFGGIKATLKSGEMIDVWVQDLADYIAIANRIGHLYYHSKRKLLKLC